MALMNKKKLSPPLPGGDIYFTIKVTCVARIGEHQAADEKAPGYSAPGAGSGPCLKRPLLLFY